MLPDPHAGSQIGVRKPFDAQGRRDGNVRRLVAVISPL